MNLRKNSLFFIFVVGLLFATSCHDDYLKRIDLLESQVDNLNSLCDQINTNIASMRKLSISLQTRDVITKLTKIYSDDGKTVIGYKISFKTGTPITIYDGVQGQIPLISTKYVASEGGYFWTIQYDGGAATFITDASGNKVPANGSVMPFLKVKDGMWYVSYDKGETFVELGQATGTDADKMFKSFNITDYYVEITLSDDTVYTIPTDLAFQVFGDEANKVNDNISALKTLTNDLKSNKYIFITDYSEIKSEDGTITGHKVTLSNGKSFTINNYTNSVIPSITIVTDEADGLDYWAIQYEGSPVEWLLNEDGEKIPAKSENIAYPIVGTAIDTIINSKNKGYFVWTSGISTSDKMDYMLDANKETILAVAKDTIFSKVVDYGTYLEIQVNGIEEVFKINKKFSVAVDSCDLIMACSDTLDVNYQIFGSEDESVELLTQAGFKASVDTATNVITIISPENFMSQVNQVMAFFTFKTNDNMTTISKTFNIVRKEEE